MCGDRSLPLAVFLCVTTLGVLLCSTKTKGLRITRPPRNETVMLNRRHKLYCKAIDDSELVFKWYHNGNRMHWKGKNYIINKQGTLRFTKVQVVDRGRYHCKVENEFQEVRQSPPAYLTVHAPAIVIGKSLFKGERVQAIGSYTWITCEAAGIPPPRIEWRKNGTLLDPLNNENSSTKIWGNSTSVASRISTLKDQVNQSSLYTCSAINSPIAGKANDSVSVSVKAIPAPLSDPSSPKQTYCAPYTGSVCRKYLQGRWVSYNSSRDYDEEGLMARLWEEMKDIGLFQSNSDQVRDGYCQGPAERLMCHLAFPDCHNETAQPLPICRESCIAVKSLFCYSQWVELDEMKQEGRVLKNRGDLRLPVCSELPSKWNASTPCIDSDHHQFDTTFVSDQCYVKYGRWYNGTVNVTKSGRPCQPWDQNFPQVHDRSPNIFPELVGAENFCRNPGAEEDHPWCYTLDKLVRWEECNVQPCDGAQPTNVPYNPGEREPLDIHGEGTKKEASEDLDFVLILALAAACIFVIIMFAVSYIIYRKFSRSRYNATPQDDLEIDVSNLPPNSAYHQIKSNRLDPKLEMLEFPRNDIEYIMDIGQGAFGRVFQARLVCSNGNSHITGGKLNLSGSKHSLSCGKHCKHTSIHNHSASKTDVRLQHLELLSPSPKEDHWLHEHIQPLSRDPQKHCLGGGDSQQVIAVKMLKEDASESIQTDFEREASLMVKFDHPNIIRLLGVCTVGKPMCLLFEYMSKGDLNGFLRNCSPDQCLIQNQADRLPPLADVSSIDAIDQLHMARQIAAGMVYISDRGYVHRDLATRNCLVGSGLVVKIADFGLARSVHSMNYYHGSDKDAIPIRWMPPEAILYNKFSSQSDVWSFGVLLWEIFTFALQPYYGMTHEEVINYLCNGKVLECPQNVSSSVYELMKNCWKRKPSARPNFNSLSKSLNSMWEDRSKKKSRQPVPV